MNQQNLELLNELDKLKKEQISDEERTIREKEKFILKLKTGLGEEIKKNPNTVIKIKKPLKQKIKENIKKLFNYIFKMF